MIIFISLFYFCFLVLGRSFLYNTKLRINLALFLRNRNILNLFLAPAARVTEALVKYRTASIIRSKYGSGDSLYDILV